MGGRSPTIRVLLVPSRTWPMRMPPLIASNMPTLAGLMPERGNRLSAPTTPMYQVRPTASALPPLNVPDPEVPMRGSEGHWKLTTDAAMPADLLESYRFFRLSCSMYGSIFCIQPGSEV